MPRLQPVALADVPASLRPIFDGAAEYMGFVANDALTMAHVPELLAAAGPFMRTIYREGRVSFELKRLVGMMSSWAAGCQYCVAHTAHGADRLGIATPKIEALHRFETDPMFSAAERAALTVARSAGQVPNAVTDAEFAALRQHFDEAQIVEIVAVVALFGFLNRWNATFATELESSPLRFAQEHLAAHGWSVGEHGSGRPPR
jgi:uncharacterized peroxidase-related enzyme